jgi:parallel beta-helix repeat protein
MKRRLLLWIVLAFTLPALACALPFTTSPEDTASQIAADIYATATAEAALPASAAQLSGPSTVHVAADGSGDYPSLEEALAAVPPESTILLDPGTYRLKHKLEIDKTISLRGAGMDQTIVVGDDASYVIRFTGPGKFTLQGITFRYEGTPWARVVSVKDGDIDFSDCSFTGGVYDDNENKGGAGLFIKGNTSGKIADCRSEDNGLHGFALHDDSKLSLERNTCSNNSQSGIAYFYNSGGLAKENNCLNNGYHGISVKGQAQPTLESNTCSNNSQAGISYWENSGGLAKENSCLNNGYHGIDVREQAQPTLEGNTCQGNTYYGISFDENSRGVVRENQIMQNGRHGIRLKGDAAPTLESNIVKDNQENGIAYFGNAGGTARQNEISGNLECITVEEDANPELIDNSCDGSVTSGSDGLRPGALLEDDFSDPNSGWVINQYDNGSVGYGDGFYFVESTSNEEVIGGVSDHEFEDVVIDVDVTLALKPANGESVAGVGCRVQRGDNAGDGYFMMIASDGYSKINKSTGGTFLTVVDWAQSAAINTGEATNHIRVICENDYLAMFANGELLIEAHDTDHSTGDISLNGITTIDGEPAKYNFDNLVVFSPGSEEPLPTRAAPPTPSAGEPYIGPLTFAKGATSDNKPVNPASEYPHNTTTVYGCYEFSGMDAYRTYKVTYYVDGKNFFTASKKWDKGESGRYCLPIGYQDGSFLWNGNWEVQIFIDNKLMQTGTFEVGN